MKLFYFIITSCILVLLSGCQQPAVWSGNNNHEPYLGNKKTLVELSFKKSDITLSQNQKRELISVLGGPRQVTAVYLANCKGPRGVTLASANRFKSLKQYLKSRGYAPIVLPSVPGNNCIRVTLLKRAVIVPNCPDMTVPNSSYTEISSNFGCVTGYNLGMMLADPEDLNAQGGSSAYDGKLAASSVERYRNRKTQVLKKESSSKL